MLLRLRWRRLALHRFGLTLALVLMLWTLFDVLSIRNAISLEAAKPPPPFANERIFIASIHWTSEAVLRDSWAPGVAALARAIGPDNVFISIYESGSFDSTKEVLELLKTDLDQSGIPHRIVLDEATHRDEVEKPPAENGWIQMPLTKQYRENWTEWFTLDKGTWVPRRIPYLADKRNVAMAPLKEMKEQEGKMFDRVLWLNDVVFTTEDVQRLLATKDGQYAAACALDFKQPPAFYDTFATRDAQGNEPLMDMWPYFASAVSRDAVRRSLPVPVASCWNGMVVFDATPWYDVLHQLSFRGIADDLAAEHLEGSECCLVHADNFLSRAKGVWINPNVRVTYNASLYNAVNPADRAAWPSTAHVVSGLWQNRLKRWAGLLRVRDRDVQSKVELWKMKDADRHREPGSFCIIDEMQVMLWNGWGHA
ncbi:putative polysaccharide export protein [Teratosphaeria nubilosa]|uniref:Putative polysaccharide export protein n=1 Tax=Teratosphaeria nubilosa TaxID=161662 RepID=A0A6G1L2N0_9PEZI|nr:putative polysaccharide export protein [Teratosphaeria nubilosa]